MVYHRKEKNKKREVFVMVACVLLLVRKRLFVYRKTLMPRATTMQSVLSRKGVLPANFIASE